MLAPVLVILGAVMLGLWGLGGYLLVRIRKNTQGLSVTGEVSGFSSYISHGRSMFCAQYRATVDGQVVTGSATVSKSWKSPPVGARWRCAIAPLHPKTRASSSIRAGCRTSLRAHVSLSATKVSGQLEKSRAAVITGP